MLADLLNAATAFVDWLATLDQGAVLLFTVLSTAVEMTFLLGLLVPGESVVMLAGSLPSGPAGFALVVALGTAGALSGQLLGYAVGRAMGNRLRGTALGRKIGAERFDKAEAYLRDRGAPALVAVRFVAVIHSVVPIVAGTARMPFGRFVGWSALGTVLWVSAFAGVGVVTAGASSGGVALVLTAIGATCLGAVPIAARLIRRALPARRSLAARRSLPAGRTLSAGRSLPAGRTLSAGRSLPALRAQVGAGLPADENATAARRPLRAQLALPARRALAARPDRLLARRALSARPDWLVRRGLPVRPVWLVRRALGARPDRQARRALPARRGIVAGQIRPAPAPAVTRAGTLVAASSV